MKAKLCGSCRSIRERLLNLFLKQDDRLCAFIYGSKWNEYDLISQRAVRVMLHEAQQERAINLAIVPLNMVTFISVICVYNDHVGTLQVIFIELLLHFQIVKSMYSYYTVLTEMV